MIIAVPFLVFKDLYESVYGIGRGGYKMGNWES